MGFWDLFKPKEKIDEKLLKLQNIVYGTDYNKIVFSKQQILDTANTIYVPRIIDIFNDSAELVDNTFVPDTFFFRLGLATETLQQLADIEDLIEFDSPLPSERLKNLANNHDIYIQQFLERYVENCANEIKKLKTKKGKIKRIEKYLTEIYSYKNKLSNSHLEYLENVKDNEFNISFYEEISISNDITFSEIPYYLDENLIIDPKELAEERKQILFSGFNNKDDKYFHYVNTLNEIKNSLTHECTPENIALCDKGLNLSIELCNYCIEKNYISSKFIISETKDYYIYFRNQKEYKTINSEFENASSLEKNGYFEKALELYLDILKKYLPRGYNYYAYPFNLAMNIFDYESASKTSDYLKEAISSKNIVNLDDLVDRFNTELQKVNSTENLYPYAKQQIINILNTNPGILQTDIYKQLGVENKESYRFILYYWEKINFIYREKSGRSYKVFLR